MKSLRLLSLFLVGFSACVNSGLRADREPAGFSDSQTTQSADPSVIELKKNWILSSPDGVNYQTEVPNTIVGTLVDQGVAGYRDPLKDTNLRNMPGTSAYAIAKEFSHTENDPASPFSKPWTYQTHFEVPDAFNGKNVWLEFDGVNNAANISLNGTSIATADDVVGGFRRFRFQVTHQLAQKGDNLLVVKVYPPTKNTLGLTFNDWNPSLPDRSMGLWRGVRLRATDAVEIRYPYVTSKLQLPNFESADLRVAAYLTNTSAKPISGQLSGTIELLGQSGSGLKPILFSKSIQVAPQHSEVPLTEMVLDAKEFSQLKLKSPAVWWPNKVGKQPLYRLSLSFVANDGITASQSVNFGVRDLSSELTPKNARLFKINGRNILIRGAGYTSDIFLKSSPDRLQAEFLYMRDLGLNAVRIEGQFQNPLFYDLADKYGIFVFAGVNCCDAWERSKQWSDEEKVVAEASVRDQIRILRSHPSALTWVNGSDNASTSEMDRRFRQVLKDEHWPNPVQSSVSSSSVAGQEKTGFKMTGPYEYVAPSYWKSGSDGGAFGFNSETSPGPAVPPIESLRKFLSPENLWPPNQTWNYHAGGKYYASLDRFSKAIDVRLGTAKNVCDYAKKAQVLAYESHRAMFEAYASKKYEATGVIQWMLNSAWPGMIWHLYDYFLRPGGAYYGAKKANEPIHIMYSYEKNAVLVLNHHYENVPDVTARLQIFDFNLKSLLDQKAELSLQPDSVTQAFSWPKVEGVTPTYFVELTLDDANQKTLSENFYWFSQKEEIAGGTVFMRIGDEYKETKSYADLTQLNTLPNVDLKLENTSIKDLGEYRVATVQLSNPSANLGFFTHLKLVKANGEEVLPIYWDENDFPMFPRQNRELKAHYFARDADETATEYVVVDGWNVNRARETCDK